VSETNRGAVLNGFIIGKRAPIVSVTVSVKVSMRLLQRV